MMDRHLAVIDVRLDALYRAIAARDWEETEFQFDRVARALEKAKVIEAALRRRPDHEPA